MFRMKRRKENGDRKEGRKKDGKDKVKIQNGRKIERYRKEM
jgi:hypothetical protein